MNRRVFLGMLAAVVPGVAMAKATSWPETLHLHVSTREALAQVAEIEARYRRLVQEMAVPSAMLGEVERTPVERDYSGVRINPYPDAPTHQTAEEFRAWVQQQHRLSTLPEMP